MNKSNYILIVFTIWQLLSACGKETMGVDDKMIIGFSSTLATRADGEVNNANLLQFGIHGYYTGQQTFEVAAPTEPNYMNNQSVVRSDASSLWRYSPLKYWPNTAGDKLSFFAYAPYNAISIGNGYTYSFTASNNLNSQTDFVAGKQLNLTKQTGAVSLILKHTLSRALFEVRTDRAVPSETTVRLKTVAFSTQTGLYQTGNYNALTTDWSDQTGSLGLAPLTTGWNLTASPVELLGVGNKFYLIPPTNTGITDATPVILTFAYDIITQDDQLGGPGSSHTSNNSATVPLPIGTLQQGKAYRFLFTIGLTGVSMTAEVEEWVDAVPVAIPGATSASASATDIMTAIDTLNQARIATEDANFDLFMVHIATSPTSNINLWNATDAELLKTKHFIEGDKVVLGFKSAPASAIAITPLAGFAITSHATDENGDCFITGIESVIMEKQSYFKIRAGHHQKIFPSEYIDTFGRYKTHNPAIEKFILELPTVLWANTEFDSFNWSDQSNPLTPTDKLVFDVTHTLLDDHFFRFIDKANTNLSFDIQENPTRRVIMAQHATVSLKAIDELFLFRMPTANTTEIDRGLALAKKNTIFCIDGTLTKNEAIEMSTSVANQTSLTDVGDFFTLDLRGINYNGFTIILTPAPSCSIDNNGAGIPVTLQSDIGSYITIKKVQ